MLPTWWKSDKPWIIGDCLEVMRGMPDKCVDLIITSPPYNLGIDYGENTNDKKPLELYYKWCKEWIKESYRLLKNGGRFCLQIGCFQPSINEPSYATFTNIFLDNGFTFRDFVIWNKNQISNRTAWGSWKSPSNPRLLPPFEMIINFHKVSPKIEHKGETDLTDIEFVDWTNALWNISTESAKETKHPAPFPPQIPLRCIKLNTYKDGIVFDPFLGSGTTLLACRKTGRIGLGCEINPDYDAIIEKRSMQNITKLDMFGGD